MLISVVNRTNGEVTDAEMQRAIRAVNRQIHEDVAPYWSRTATLRLEGTLPSSPDPEEAASHSHGRAVIYVCECVEQEEYLGFHNVDLGGVAFGFVFLDLAEELGENWTVTLSHEALELLMDPEANLLAKGPHPEEPDREVFHWYELCDAVQSETYLIDEVEVSNFLLPLYFTVGDEEGGRNDFLGKIRQDGGALVSFGVSPGGYIGFYDPLTQRHEMHTADEQSDERMRIKMQAKLSRRAKRYQRPNLAEAEITPIKEPPDLPPPELEGFIVEVAGSGDRLYEVAREAVRAVLGEDWRLQALGSEPSAVFDVVSDDFDFSPAEAWQTAHELRARPGVRRAEPMFRAALAGWRDRHDPELAVNRGVRASGIAGRDLPEAAADPEWSLEQMRVRQAWALFPQGRLPGQGIRVGHPDTGYTRHPEIWHEEDASRRVDLEHDFDFVRDLEDALDPLVDDEFLSFPGHGTGTASVILSGEGDQDSAEGFVTGVAPGATLVPFRVSHSVAHFSMRNLTRAVYRAIERDCHVISMSLGGFWSWSLRNALREAERQGLIVLAAAGNYVGFVVWPAAFDEVIAVAGNNVRKRPWSGSSRGRQVDISGPAESVWRAAVRQAGERRRFSVGMGDGTSYAVASAAGVAALWLSLHGREALIDRYGKPNLAGVFRSLLRQASQVPEGWDTRRFGAGIVDAEALLSTPLPQAVPSASLRRPALAPDGSGGLEPFSNIVDDISPEDLRAGLCSAFGLSAQDLSGVLDSAGDELLFHLCCHPDLRESVRRAARLARGQPVAARSAVPAARVGLAALGCSSHLRQCLRIEE